MKTQKLVFDFGVRKVYIESKHPFVSDMKKDDILNSTNLNYIFHVGTSYLDKMMDEQIHSIYSISTKWIVEHREWVPGEGEMELHVFLNTF